MAEYYGGDNGPTWLVEVVVPLTLVLSEARRSPGNSTNCHEADPTLPVGRVATISAYKTIEVPSHRIETLGHSLRTLELRG